MGFDINCDIKDTGISINLLIISFCFGFLDDNLFYMGGVISHIQLKRVFKPPSVLPNPILNFIFNFKYKIYL